MPTLLTWNASSTPWQATEASIRGGGGQQKQASEAGSRSTQRKLAWSAFSTPRRQLDERTTGRWVGALVKWVAVFFGLAQERDTCARERRPHVAEERKERGEAPLPRNANTQSTEYGSRGPSPVSASCRGFRAPPQAPLCWRNWTPCGPSTLRPRGSTSAPARLESRRAPRRGPASAARQVGEECSDQSRCWRGPRAGAGAGAGASGSRDEAGGGCGLEVDGGKEGREEKTGRRREGEREGGRRMDGRGQ